MHHVKIIIFRSQILYVNFTQRYSLRVRYRSVSHDIINNAESSKHATRVRFCLNRAHSLRTHLTYANITVAWRKFRLIASDAYAHVVRIVKGRGPVMDSTTDAIV